MVELHFPYRSTLTIYYYTGASLHSSYSCRSQEKMTPSFLKFRVKLRPWGRGRYNFGDHHPAKQLVYSNFRASSSWAEWFIPTACSLPNATDLVDLVSFARIIRSWWCFLSCDEISYHVSSRRSIFVFAMAKLAESMLLLREPPASEFESSGVEDFSDQARSVSEEDLIFEDENVLHTWSLLPDLLLEKARHLCTNQFRPSSAFQLLTITDWFRFSPSYHWGIDTMPLLFVSIGMMCSTHRHFGENWSWQKAHSHIKDSPLTKVTGQNWAITRYPQWWEVTLVIDVFTLVIDAFTCSL